MDLRVLYRGPLESCNYGCTYCPFAKRTEGRVALERDRRALERFVARVSALRAHRFGLFFTPWGEALVRRSYQDAIVRLSREPHVERVAVQTNLSGRLDWLGRADARKVGLWATYHPEWTPREAFVAKVRAALAAGARVSAGVVGMRRFAGEIEGLRRALPEEVYLWINAVKSTPAPEPYDAADVARFLAVDPLFEQSLARHESLGRACRTGETVFTVDGEGVMRRCHFVRDALGSFYADGFEEVLRPRLCPNATCSCHIGYVHMPGLGLDAVYGDGVLERVPARRVSLPVVTGPGTG